MGHFSPPSVYGIEFLRLLRSIYPSHKKKSTFDLRLIHAGDPGGLVSQLIDCQPSYGICYHTHQPAGWYFF